MMLPVIQKSDRAKSAERSRKHRQNYRDQGYRQKMVWVHPDDMKRFEQFVESLDKPEVSNDHS